ncbi:MAG: MCE family protein [Acetobacteraceae bacterium]|nr:MCE family protein [Acetobacteraceae bacterium]
MAIGVQWKARLIFAGLFCACGLGAYAWHIWSAEQFRTYRLETRDSVSGLIVDSPVEFHGVEVGAVTKIELSDPSTVSIRLRIAKGAPISKATVATITARGLAARGFTGYVYVALENTGPDSGAPQPGPGQSDPVILTAPSRIDTVDTTAAGAIAKLQALMELLQSVLDEKTVASLKQSVDGLRDILDEKTIASLKQSVDGLRDILDERTVASLKQSVDGLRDITATLAANNQRMASLIVNAERASRDMRPLLDASDATLRELRTQVLPQFYRAIGDMDGLTRSLNGMANRLARDPSALLRGTAMPPGPGER